MTLLGRFSAALAVCALNVAAAVCAGIGARYWLSASKVPTKPNVIDQTTPVEMIPAVLSERGGWEWPFLQALMKAAALNASAARWTAAAAALSGAAAIVSAVVLWVP